MGSVLSAIGVIAILAVGFLVLAPYLGITLWGPGSVDLSHKWGLTIATDPAVGPSVEPAGYVTVDEFRALTVKAYETTAWAFRGWMLDNATFGDSPQVTVPAQTAGSEHVLKALFAARIQTFVISPPSIIATHGVGSGFTLTLNNNGDANITAIQLRLNDPQDIFHDFALEVDPLPGNYAHPILDIYTNIQRDCNAHGSTYISASYQVNPTVAPGTYHLSFSILFSTSGGSFNSPPELTIPWDVTVLG